MLKVNGKGQEGGWRKRLQCEIQVQTVFALCSRSAWGMATKELQALKEMLPELLDPQELSVQMLVPLLEASILQGTGETEKALEIYMQPPLSLATAESPTSSSVSRDISILATLNALLIICLPNHHRHSEFDDLFSRLEPLTLEHPSRDILAAYNLVHAVSLNTGPDVIDAESASMLKTKQYLTQALQGAKRTGNNQLCCITLNFMTWRYFRGVVGEQPVKSAMSAQALARKGQNSLWMSVADGLLADTLETQGRTNESDSTRQESLDLAGKLPMLMQRNTVQPRM
jgi:Cohesin loading factor